jgi:hypothetical protein
MYVIIVDVTSPNSVAAYRWMDFITPVLAGIGALGTVASAIVSISISFIGNITLLTI